jgi:hypothetical protein
MRRFCINELQLQNKHTNKIKGTSYKMFNKLQTTNNPQVQKINPKHANIDNISKANMLHEIAAPQ